MQPHRWTVAELDYVAEQRALGVSWKAIARHFGVADRTIQEAWRKKRGAPPPSPPPLSTNPRNRHVHLYLTPEDHTALSLRAQRERRTMNALAAYIISRYLSQP